MKTQKHNLSANLLFLFSLVATQTLASEETYKIFELCRSSNDTGIKRVINYILTDERASATEILCQKRLNKSSEETMIEASYTINEMTDSEFRKAHGSVKSVTQSRFESATKQSTLQYSNISEPDSRITLPTLKGFQTVAE